MNAGSTVLRVLRLLWELDRRSLLTDLLGSMTGLATSALLLYFVKDAFQFILNGEGSLWPLAGLVAVLAVQQLVAAFGQTAETLLRQEASAHLNAQLLRKLEAVPYPLFEDNAFQAEYGLLVREASHRPAMLVDALAGGFFAAFSLAGLLIGLSVAASPLVLLVLLLIAPTVLFEGRFRSRLIDVQTMASPQLLRMQFLAQQSVDAAWQRELRVYDSHLLASEYRVLATGYLAQLRAVILRLQLGRIGVALLETAGLAATLLGAFALVRTGAVKPVTAAVVLTGFYLALGQSRSLAVSAGSLVDSLGYAGRLWDFLALDFGEPPRPSRLAAGGDEARQQATGIALVRAEGVGFTYASSTRPALRGVTCDFDVGLTAVVGPNGAGKSTLLRLLAGLSPPAEGTLGWVDGAGALHPLETLRRSVLFQSATHFQLTVRQIVTMAPDAEERGQVADERILAALDEAGLADVVRALPAGLDTPVGVGFGGFTDLSGGQWQRLSVARVVYHDAPLVLLDEPAASLDAEGEASLLALLQRQARSRVIVVVTHQYSSAAACGKVIVLADGTVVEQGAPDDLIVDGRSFFKLYLSRR